MMKRLSMIFIFAALLFIPPLIFAGFSAKHVTLNNSWNSLQYEKFETKIDVQGLFYETTVTVKGYLASQQDSYYSGHAWHTRCVRPEDGDYAWTWTFSLPDECLITDFQIWDDRLETYVPAQKGT